MVRPAPALRDSDVIYLTVRKLEQVAHKMTRYEYDSEMEKLMAEAVEYMDWLSEVMEARASARQETR